MNAIEFKQVSKKFDHFYIKLADINSPREDESKIFYFY